MNNKLVVRWALGAFTLVSRTYNLRHLVLRNMKKGCEAAFFMRTVLSIVTFIFMLGCGGCTRQNQVTAPVPPDALQVQAEIHTIEKLLPNLPDRGAALMQLAHDYAYLGNLPEGLSLLKQCVALREGFDPDSDPAFIRLKTNPEFIKLLDQVHTQFPPVHRAHFAFTVPEKDLVPEGLAVDNARNVFYMGSMNRGKIVRIARDGSVSDLTTANQYGLHSICGIKVEPSNGNLWVNVCPYNGTGAELVHFDTHGHLLERFGAPGEGSHLFNDLILRKSEAIFVTDSLANQVYRFNRKTHVFSVLLFPRELYYPNGIALSDDGDSLYVSDAFGTLRYDLRNQKGQEVEPGSANTVSGFDGLYWYESSLVGIQNSLGAARVAQFHLSADGLRVTSASILENRSEFVTSPTTGAVYGSKFYFMTNTHIDEWKDGKVVDARALEPVQIGVLDLR